MPNILRKLIKNAFINEKYGPVNVLTYFSLFILIVVHIFNFQHVPINKTTLFFAGSIIITCVVSFILSMIYSSWLKKLRDIHTVVASVSIIVLTIEGLYYPSGFILIGMMTTMVSFIFVFPNLKTTLYYLSLVIICYYVIYNNFVTHPEIQIYTHPLDLLLGSLLLILIVGSTTYYRELTNDINTQREQEMERRKETEKQLEKINRIHSGLAENIPFEIAILTKEGIYEYVNPRFANNGSKRDYYHGRTDLELFQKFGYLNRNIAEKRMKAISECVLLGENISIIESEHNSLGKVVTKIRNYFPTKKTSENSVEIISYGWEVKERKDNAGITI